MIKKEELNKVKAYYSNCKLWLPTKPQWRFFTFKMFDDSFKRFHISSEKELRRLLLLFVPKVVYYSCGKWANVQNVRGKTKTTSYPINLGSDLIFDLDGESIVEAKNSAKKIVEIIGKPSYILMTRRGFHICYFDAHDKKEQYLKELEGISCVDRKCTLNDFNVFSLPFTLNKSGTINTFIEDLDNLPVREQVYNPLNIEDTSESQSNTGNETLRRQNSRLTTGTEGTVLAFSNQVKRKLFIPILIYDKKLKGLKAEILRLVVHYDLGSLYCFENENQLAFISLKCMDQRRLAKLLNNSRSLNKVQLDKFGKLWFNFSKFYPKAIIHFESVRFFRASRKHYSGLMKMGFPSCQQINLIGKQDLPFYEVHLK